MLRLCAGLGSTRACDDLVDLVRRALHDLARTRAAALERRADERFVEQGADRVDVARRRRRAALLELGRDAALHRDQARAHGGERAGTEREIGNADAAGAADDDRLR
jgi:hypothetical protein